jgi:hypothetical protein
MPKRFCNLFIVGQKMGSNCFPNGNTPCSFPIIMSPHAVEVESTGSVGTMNSVAGVGAESAKLHSDNAKTALLAKDIAGGVSHAGIQYAVVDKWVK